MHAVDSVAQLSLELLELVYLTAAALGFLQFGSSPIHLKLRVIVIFALSIGIVLFLLDGLDAVVELLELEDAARSLVGEGMRAHVVVRVAVQAHQMGDRNEVDHASEAELCAFADDILAA